MSFVADVLVWLVLGLYVGGYLVVTRRLTRLVARIEVALSDTSADAIRVKAWSVIGENEQLRAELQSKEHHIAAMQARINGLEGRAKP